jgi:hypothetical protein
MSLFRDPELVRQVIRGQGLTRGAAWDTNRRDKLAMDEVDSPDELVARFDAVLALLTGPFRYEAWEKGSAQDVGGRKSDGRVPFVWLVQGQGSNGHDNAAQGQPAVQYMPQAPAVDISLHVKLATLEIQLDHERKERERLERELDEPAPVGDSMDIVAMVKELLATLRPQVPAATGKAITGTSSGLVSSDQELLAAMDRMARQHPDAVAAYKQQILAQYGTE